MGFSHLPKRLGDSIATIWDINNEVTKLILPHGNSVLKAEFSSDEKKIVTIGDDEFVYIWDAITGDSISKFNLNNEDYYDVSKIEFSSDGSYLLLVFDNRIDVINSKSGEIEAQRLIEDDDFLDEFMYAEFSKNDSTIVIAEQNYATLWSWKSDEIIRDFIGHSYIVQSAVFSADATSLLTISDDESLRVWDVETGASSQVIKIKILDNFLYTIRAKHTPNIDEALVIVNKKVTIYNYNLSSKIIDWFDEIDNFYKLNNNDLQQLGVDFIKVED